MTNFAVGDRVVAEPKNEACGKCDVCREGKINLCLHRRAPGWGVHGGMTSYIAMPEFLVHHIPEGVSYDVAALCEPMACIVYAVTERAKLECADVVYISGAGPMGVLSAFVAKSCGASKVVMSGMTRSEAVRFPVAPQSRRGLRAQRGKGRPCEICDGPDRRPGRGPRCGNERRGPRHRRDDGPDQALRPYQRHRDRRP